MSFLDHLRQTTPEVATTAEAPPAPSTTEANRPPVDPNGPLPPYPFLESNFLSLVHLRFPNDCASVAGRLSEGESRRAGENVKGRPLFVQEISARGRDMISRALVRAYLPGGGPRKRRAVAGLLRQDKTTHGMSEERILRIINIM